MTKILFQEVLEGVRIDWLDTGEIPEQARVHAREQVQMLRDRCQQMRALAIEYRDDETRLLCNCLDRKRAIRVTRPGLLAALRAFAETLRSRCTP